MPIAPDCNEPQPFIGLVSLMRKVSSGEDLSHLVNIASYNPNDANRLMGLSIIFQLTGNREMGLELQGKALALQQLYHLPSPNVLTGIRLLVLMRPGDMMDNTPVDFLLEDSDVALDILYISSNLPCPTSLPEHDVVMVAIGQSDENLPLLQQAEEMLTSTSRPILNKPARIACLSRESVSDLLSSIPGVNIPWTARVSRENLEQVFCGEISITSLLKEGSFPIIVRPLGSHGGEGLARIERPEAISDYLSTLSAEQFNIARFIEYRSQDGFYRKCRIALIDGKPFVCHLAISENWMIHYKSAGMSESVSKRAEEALFMANFDEDFGRKHEKAFRAIGERLGLDYLVIDCGETPAGELLIFEADNLGFVHALDPVDVFPYKQPQMRKVFGAFYGMFKKAKDRVFE